MVSLQQRDIFIPFLKAGIMCRICGIPVHQTEYTSETYEAEEQGTDSRTAKAGDKVLLTGGENAFIADFTSNQTEHAAFPFSIWNKTMRAVMNDYQKEMMINPLWRCDGTAEKYFQLS